MFSNLCYAIPLHYSVATPAAGAGTVLRGLHKMPWQGILAGWGRRISRKRSKTEIPELATLSEVSMKLPSCGAVKGWIWWCPHALTPPDVTLTPRAMAPSPFSLAASLAASSCLCTSPSRAQGSTRLSAGHCHPHPGGVQPK